MILDPTTAKTTLTLSADLSKVTEGAVQDLPNNPERFSFQPFVLGSEGFKSGTHSWVVEVGKSIDWIIGVAKESVKRKENIKHFQKNGIWAIRFYNRKYSFKVSSSVVRYPRIKVELDSVARQLRFYNPDTNEHLHSFKKVSRGTLYPLLGTKYGGSLKILPEKVSVKCSYSDSPVSVPNPGPLKTTSTSSSSDSDSEVDLFKSFAPTSTNEG